MSVPANRRAVLIVTALAFTLIVGRVAGTSQDDADGGVIEAVTKPSSPRHAETSAPLANLSIERPRRGPADPKVADLFGGRSWLPPPQPVVAAPAPPPPPPLPARPVAPPLPFAYIGQIEEEEGKPVYFLSMGAKLISVSVGDVIDDVYKVEAAADGQLVLVYVPLDQRQPLRMGTSR
jgi:hypothetical protein